MAARRMRGERGNHTLAPTALVHEVWLRLAGSAVDPSSRAEFLGIAARAMRQVLVDHARRHRAGKRGGDRVQTTLPDVAGTPMPLDDVIALDVALDRLAAIDPRLRAVVEYRFFLGLSEQEIADLLRVSERSVQRDWVRARAWLYSELYRTHD